MRTIYTDNYFSLNLEKQAGLHIPIDIFRKWLKQKGYVYEEKHGSHQVWINNGKVPPEFYHIINNKKIPSKRIVIKHDYGSEFHPYMFVGFIKNYVMGMTVNQALIDMGLRVDNEELNDKKVAEDQPEYIPQYEAIYYEGEDYKITSARNAAISILNKDSAENALETFIKMIPRSLFYDKDFQNALKNISNRTSKEEIAKFINSKFI